MKVYESSPKVALMLRRHPLSVPEAHPVPPGAANRQQSMRAAEEARSGWEFGIWNLGFGRLVEAFGALEALGLFLSLFVLSDVCVVFFLL